MKTPRLKIKPPFGMRLVSVAELPSLQYPTHGDPRTRHADGSLKYAEIHASRNEPAFLRVKITQAEKRRERVGADSPKVDWVYWLFRDYGCGFSGMTAECARCDYILVMDSE